MISKNLYINLAFFVIIIALSSAAGCFFIFGQHNYITALALVMLIIIEIIVLIRYLNITNRRLAYFVSAIRNEDTSLKFPDDLKHKPTLDLYNSLAIVNEIIKKTKISSEYNENLFRTLIEYSYTGFITIDETGDFEVLNNAARKYLGVQYTSNMKALMQKDPSLHNLLSNIQPGQSHVQRIERDGGLFIVSVTATDIVFYEKKYRIISLHDISKELDKQELESWHKLFKVMTHEIMNSIAPITSMSNTLNKLYHANNTTIEPSEITAKIITNTVAGLKSIEEIGNGLKNFVENYRELNKIPKPKIDKVNTEKWISILKTIIEEIIQEHSIQFSITINSACNFIYCDEQLLTQVIINLVNNSVDAMNDSQHKRLAISIEPTSYAKTLISVKDSGKGIPAEDIDKIFVPFYTTKENGNGIGLSISKQIISLHGGTISIRSEMNQGCEVVISI